MIKRAGSGRVARKIGSHDEESAESTDTSQGGARNLQADAVVKRPTFAKAKKRSSQRVSFGPSGDDGDESSDTAVVTPKKSALSRIAIEKNAERRARSPLVAEVPRPQAGLDDARPSYSKDHLAELRNSTPSTPKDLKPTSDEEDDLQALDIVSKFGASHSYATDAPSAIPTQSEIQAKKARRARLAKEHAAADDEDRPWASDDDDEFRTHRNEISLRPKDKYAETRLVHEDEDIAEGFDEYVEDGKISLGRRAEREAKRKRRAEMAELINDAEGISDDDTTDDSEAERNAAYEDAQTRAGAYGKKIQTIDNGARTPPKITPLPELGEVLERLKAELQNKEQKRDAMRNRIEELKEEKIRNAERQKYLQEQLRETGENYEKLRIEAGMPALPASAPDGGRLIVDRGLESIGTTPMGTTPIGNTPMGSTPVAARSDEDMEEDEEEEDEEGGYFIPFSQ